MSEVVDLNSLSLGQRVRFSHFSYVTYEDVFRTPPKPGEIKIPEVRQRRWLRVPGPVRDGIVIGVRTRYNGEYWGAQGSKTWGSYDDTWEPASLINRTAVRLALVSFDLKQEPHLVFPEDLELLE